MARIQTYRELEVWQKGVALVNDIYEVANGFSTEEKFGLSSQMKRSSVSIPSNIAEGFRRQHNKEFRQFLYITLGSCAELETQVTIAKTLGFIEDGVERDLLEKLDHICRMTSNLIKKL
jgi:four helix bundle protein